MSQAITNTQHYSDIASAIRAKTGRNTTLKPSEMATEINSIVTSTPETWQRPVGMPDYSQITFSSSDEVLYLTYDTTIANLQSNFTSFIITGSATTIEWGTLSNGTFTAAGQESLAAGGNYRAQLPTNLGRYVVYKITPSGTTHITRFYLSTSDVTIGSQRIEAIRQPLVEIYCRLPYITSLVGPLVSEHTISFSHYGSIAPTQLASAFYYGYVLEHIYFEDLDASNCTTFANAFRDCFVLKYLDFDLDVSNKCTTLTYMFYRARQIQRLPFDLSTWDVSKVTVFSFMFAGCSSLVELNVSGWNVSSSTTFEQTFGSCVSLSSLNLSHWYAPNCKQLVDMFTACNSLKVIDLGALKPSAVTTIKEVFYNCIALTSVNVSNLVNDKCTTLTTAFANTYNLVNIVGLNTWDTSAVTSAASCFNGATSISELDLSGWDLSSITTLGGTGSFLRYCYQLEKITFPSTLGYCGQYFAQNTSNIHEYHFLNATPASLYSAAQFPKYTGMKMYVPIGTLSDYQTAWSGYTAYLEEEGT